MRCRVLLFSMMLIIIALSSACIAAGKGESAKIKSFWKSTTPIIIPVTDKDSVAQVQFPAVPKKEGQLPVIRFKAYLKTKINAGMSYYTALDLNGKTLVSSLGNGAFRLINKAPKDETRFGPYTQFSDNKLLTFFYPGTGDIDSRMVTGHEEGCWYLLDISDAVNQVVVGVDNRVESQGTNKFTITNSYTLQKEGETADCKELVIENLEVGYLPITEVNKLRPTESFPINSVSGPSLAIGNAKIIAGKDGSLELKIGKESYHYTGLYSYPAKDMIKFNGLGMKSTSSADWKITSFLDNKNKTLVIKGNWKNYTVTRKIDIHNGHFRVIDNISNKTDQPIGMKIRYNTIVKNPFEKDNAFVCGSASLETTDNCPTNPSMYIRQKNSSMGIVVEDTLLRLQMEIARKGNRIEFSTNHFGLDARKSYNIEWSIYPSKSTDYWDFVNRVRRDWKVNFTVLGPCPLGDENIVPGRKALIYPVNPWFRYYNGAKYTAEEYKALVKPKVDKLLAAQPDAIPMALTETNLVPYDTRESGGIVPTGQMTGSDDARNGVYGLELTTEQTEWMKKTPWWDSQIKTSDGRGVIDTYYGEYPYSDLMVYPAPGNYQLKYMKWQADFLMDEVGMKGIYMDQFNLGIRLTQPGRCDYSKWDGHTVDLDNNGEITRKYTDCTYVGSPARAEIIKHILDKGGLVLTNGHPVARETSGLQIHAFAETEWDVSTGEEVLAWNEPPYLPAIAEAQLSSPISLGIRSTRFNEFGKEHTAEIIQKWVIACMKNGTVYYYYTFIIPKDGPGAGEYGIINHMFPFTPVELHSGWLVGKERILTAKSGSYFWAHAKKPIVLAFDIKGYQIDPLSVKMIRKGTGWQVNLAIQDWQQTAVIKDPSEK